MVTCRATVGNGGRQSATSGWWSWPPPLNWVALLSALLVLAVGGLLVALHGDLQCVAHGEWARRSATSVPCWWSWPLFGGTVERGGGDGRGLLGGTVEHGDQQCDETGHAEWARRS